MNKQSPQRFKTTESLLNSLYQKVTKAEHESDPLNQYINQQRPSSQLKKQANYPRVQQKMSKNVVVLEDSFQMQSNIKKSDPQVQDQISLLKQKLGMLEQRQYLMKTYQQEIQYLKKVNFMQNEQIQKLRRMLRSQVVSKNVKTVGKDKNQSMTMIGGGYGHLGNNFQTPVSQLIYHKNTKVKKEKDRYTSNLSMSRQNKKKVTRR